MSTALESPMELNAGPSSAAACRVVFGNSCGSGAYCGLYQDGWLVLTNAHVAGTTPGKEGTVRFVENGQMQEKKARVVMAAYSDKTLTDWSVLHIEGSRPIKPVKLSKQRPSGIHYTTGAPRCVWPLQSQSITTVSLSSGNALWQWRPNSIGGQSGSGVWSVSDNLQYGLLTWSWNGNGAGQMTSEIYRQASQRTTAGDPRVDGLVELNGDRAEDVNEGFFMQAGIDDLPIWHDPATPPPDEPIPSGDMTTAQFIEHLRAVEEFYRKQREKYEAAKPGASVPNQPSGGGNFGL